ncbi:hypothetical protein E3P99_03597 [Wallemia hederae]|uniref:FAD-binding FR-type domain-containing protein n=1 Tax=Wallemia hederae TaxID=1540922 RepID=A0A4T0FES7_9BASI|nr:hypothetical protein E3P99_03597 [Wallemia hederae]
MLRGVIRNTKLAVNARKFSTVNKDEVEFFSRLSKHWWDESGEFGLLHKMNPARLEFILRNINNARTEDAIRHKTSEVETLARLGAITTGIDVTEANIKMAELHAKQDTSFSEHNLQYKYVAAEELSKSSKQSFDLVCAMEVVEHVDKPADFLRTCSDLVKPGGHLFISTISRTPLSKFLTITMAQDVLGLVSQGTHNFEKYIKPAELVDFFQKEIGWLDEHDVTLDDTSLLSLVDSTPLLNRLKGQINGMVYLPWQDSLKDNLDPLQFSKFTVSSITDINFDTKLLKIALPPSKFPTQFNNVIHHVWLKQPFIQIERPFTPIKPLTNDTKEIELLVRCYQSSEIGNYIRNLRANDEIELRGPNLSFDLSLYNKPNLVFIVAGTAITPAIQAIQHYKKNKTDTKISLIYSYSNEDSAYLKNELLDLQNDFDNLKTHFIDTSAQGRLDLHKLKHSLGLKTSWFDIAHDKANSIQLEDANFIISGNENFIQDVAGRRGLFNQGELGGLLSRLDIRKDQVRKL